ncbi:MAG: type II secretion system protein, partial [Pseudomonadota bacterium]
MSGASQKHTGFTLVELLIVVIILGTLTAIVVPQFGATTSDATKASYETTLSVMIKAVERYRAEHSGVYPGRRATAGSGTNGFCTQNGGAAPPGGPKTGEAFVAQLTHFTTNWGSACTVRTRALRLGPYLNDGIPVNPLGSTNAVVVVEDGVLGLTSGGTGGWRFDVFTGELIG